MVCVPARNEADRLPTLLSALAAQTLRPKVVIALNNTSDASRDVIAMFQRSVPAFDIAIDDIDFPPDQANAGYARRRAMNIGARAAGEDGRLISTDADTRPPPHWVAANLAALDRGLDIVGGQIRLDDDEPIPLALRDATSKTAGYWSAVRAIEDAIDPVAWDPAPRHGDHTGASLALRVSCYKASGGVPCIPSGEDRALVNAIRLAGGKLGHPPDVWTRVSARTVGRAQSGMAEDMARWTDAAGRRKAIMLPHFDHWRARSEWRRDIRLRQGAAAMIALEEALPPMPCDMAL